MGFEGRAGVCQADKAESRLERKGMVIPLWGIACAKAQKHNSGLVAQELLSPESWDVSCVAGRGWLLAWQG